MTDAAPPPNIPGLAFHLRRAIRTTRPLDETPDEETDRCVAIVDMVQALDPRDGTQAALACHIVGVDFMADDALRAVNDPDAKPARRPGLRRDALAASRALSQLNTKYQKLKEAAEAAAATPKPAPNPRQPRPQDAAAEAPPPTPNRDRTPEAHANPDAAAEAALTGQNADRTPPAEVPDGQAPTEIWSPSPEVAAWMKRASHHLADSFDQGLKMSEALSAVAKME